MTAREQHCTEPGRATPTWDTSDECTVCGTPYDEHSFRDALTCIAAGGTPWSQFEIAAWVDPVVRLGSEGAP